jgi:drug/metabolite transporter (DMT)-like permease
MTTVSPPADTSIVLHRSAQPTWLIIGALLSVYIIWGSTYLVVRVAIDTMPPLILSAMRFLGAGAIMFVFLRLRNVPMPTRVQIRNGLITGVLMLGVGGGGTAFAEQWVSSGLAALAVGAVPLWAALFAGIWERFPNRREWIGLLIGLTGLVLLNLEDGLRASGVGAIVMFLAPISWAFGSMWSRHLDLPRGLMVVAFQMFGGGLLMAVLALLTGESITQPPSAEAWWSLLYLMTFGSLLAYTAYAFLLQNVRATLATSYAYVNPAVAVVLGAVVLNEQLSTLGWIAVPVILGGVALLLFTRGRKK